MEALVIFPLEVDVKGQTYRGGILSSNGVMIWIDEEDFDRLVKYSWRVETNGYARRSGHRSHTLMHRQILGLGRVDSDVDHINRNRIDNQKHNLRTVTASQNQWNRNVIPVDFDGRYKKPWVPRIKKFGKSRRGPQRYATRQEAVEAGKAFKRTLHGEFSGVR